MHTMHSENETVANLRSFPAVRDFKVTLLEWIQRDFHSEIIRNEHNVKFILEWHAEMHQSVVNILGAYR